MTQKENHDHYRHVMVKYNRNSIWNGNHIDAPVDVELRTD